MEICPTCWRMITIDWATETETTKSTNQPGKPANYRLAGKPPLVVTKHLLHKDTCTIHCILHEKTTTATENHNLQLECPVPCLFLPVGHSQLISRCWVFPPPKKKKIICWVVFLSQTCLLVLFFWGDVKLSTPHVTCWHQRHQLQHPQNGKKTSKALRMWNKTCHQLRRVVGVYPPWNDHSKFAPETRPFFAPNLEMNHLPTIEKIRGENVSFILQFPHARILELIPAL